MAPTGNAAADGCGFGVSTLGCSTGTADFDFVAAVFVTSEGGLESNDVVFANVDLVGANDLCALLDVSPLAADCC